MSLTCQKAGLRHEAEEAMAQAMEKQWARAVRRRSECLVPCLCATAVPAV